MSVPAANMIVQNNSEGSISVAGIVIPAGDSYTFQLGQLSSLCLDLTFRAAYISGVLAIQVNGYGLNPSTAQTTDLLDMIASGNFG